MSKIREVKFYTVEERKVVVGPAQDYIQFQRMEKLPPLMVENPEGELDLCFEVIHAPIRHIHCRRSRYEFVDEYIAIDPRVRQLIEEEFHAEIERLQARLLTQTDIADSWAETVDRFKKLPMWKRVWYAANNCI